MAEVWKTMECSISSEARGEGTGEDSHEVFLHSRQQAMGTTAEPIRTPMVSYTKPSGNPMTFRMMPMTPMMIPASKRLRMQTQDYEQNKNKTK